MKIYFSWDDGAPEDVKLFELHEKYEIPAIFFVPTKNSEGRKVLTPETIKNSESEMISFGGHTQNHTFLTGIPLENVDKEIEDNKHYLQDTLGHEIHHFCLPGGAYNDEVLKKAFLYYETVRTADTMCFSSKRRLIRPTIHFFDRGYRSLVGNSIRQHSSKALMYLLHSPYIDYFYTIRKLVEKFEESDAEIIVWGHSWELEENNLWPEIDAFLSSINREMVGKYF